MRRRRGRPHGGQGGAEPRARVRLRAVQVLDRTLAGESQTQIATALKISQAAVSKILRRVEDQLLREAAHTLERQRARHLLHLRHLYRELIRAWNASHQDVVRKRQRQSGGAGPTGATMAELVSENRHGDPRYLEVARQVLADERKVLGLEAPEQLTVATTPFSAMSESALQAELVRQHHLLQIGTGPAPTDGTGAPSGSSPAADATPEVSHES